MQSVKQLQHAVCCRIQSCGRPLSRITHGSVTTARAIATRCCCVRQKAGAAGDSPDRTDQRAPEPPVRVRSAHPAECPAAPAAAQHFQRCHARQQPELLETQSRSLTAQTRPLFCRQMRDCCSVEQIFAVGQLSSRPRMHECAFARAGCAGHRNVVTVLHGQIDRIERT